MKTVILFISVIAFVACKPLHVMSQGERFALTDAEKILGEPAHLINESKAQVDGVINTHIDYAANDTDRVSGKLGVVYVLLQTFADTVSAQARYVGIYEANSSHEGVRVLGDLRDEAYFHSDGTNFLFIMARRGVHLLTMKVNKITSHTSRGAFDEVARRIVESW